MTPRWPGILADLVSGHDLTAEQATWAMSSILAGEATSAQIAGFAVALRAKGETALEIESMAEAMLAHANLVPAAPCAIFDGPILDVVGTGGDQLHTVNISTMAALVCAAAGARVIKHGNRAASSSTGTADVLEALGVAIDLEPDAVAECAETTGLGFCFAPVHHPAMRHAGPTRRELGIPTAFNILGPLTNPAGANAALIGCAALTWAPTMAEVLARRGVSAIVVRGQDGLDEISTCAPTEIWDTRTGDVQVSTFDAAELGIPRATIEDLRGGDSARNAQLLVKTLGPCARDDLDYPQVEAIRNAVAVNAAAALVAFEAADKTSSTDPAKSLAEAIVPHLERARVVISRGAALDRLQEWARVSQSLRPSAAD